MRQMAYFLTLIALIKNIRTVTSGSRNTFRLILCIILRNADIIRATAVPNYRFLWSLQRLDMSVVDLSE